MDLFLVDIAIFVVTMLLLVTGTVAACRRDWRAWPVGRRPTEELLATRLIDGTLTPEEYRDAMARLAARDTVRDFVDVPQDPGHTYS